MSTLRAPLLGFLLLTGLVACDPDEGSRFADPYFSREVRGRVLRGTESVPGVYVNVAASEGLVPENFPREGVGGVTDITGVYRFPFAPLRYDLSLRDGRTLTTLRGVSHRGFEPSIGDAATPRAWPARVDPTLSGANPGDGVTYVVSGSGGDEVVAGGGDLARGATALIRPFAAKVQVHALAIGASAAVVGYGKVEVMARANQAVPTALTVTPVEQGTLTVRVNAPLALAVGDVEILVDFGLRTSSLVVAKGKVDAALPIPLLPARYAARVVAVGPGVTSESALFFFDPTAGQTTLTLAAPPAQLAPAPDAVVTAGQAFESQAAGVKEHVLEPIDGLGTIVRVVTTDGRFTLPDPAAAGLSALRGRYRWTTRAYAKLEFVEQLSGPDVRSVAASATASRVVVFP